MSLMPSRRLPALSLALLTLSIGIAPAHPVHKPETTASAETPEPSKNPQPAKAPETAVLLVTAPELAEAWKPFAAWKKSLGKPTRIVTTAEIDAALKEGDLQEKIRRFVRTHIDEEGTRWIILGGDSLPNGEGLVPDRDTVHKTMWGENTKIPTDIYYISSKNWDADGDGIYGEWEEDRDAIEYPDGTIGLGRIPVRAPEDVMAYTEKVIAYESQYPEDEFATNMVYTCTVGAAYPKVRRSWDDHVSKVLKGGSVKRFFADESPWDGDVKGDYDLSPANWTKLINEKKTGKMHIHGHGLLPCWVLEHDRMVTDKHVAKLSNKNAYPVITTVSCFTGQYDAGKDPSIAESMLRQPAAGAVLIVAPSREGKPHFLDPRRDFQLMVKEGKLDGTTGTMTGFWEHGIGANLSAGEAMMTAKADRTKDARQAATFHLCLCELNLLGDPTLPLRATAPRTPKIKHPEIIKAGTHDLSIQTDAPGATVCVMDKRGLYQVLTADDSGLAQTAVTATQGIALRVMVSGTGLNARAVAILVR